MDSCTHPLQLYCRLGKTVMENPSTAAEAVRRLENAGVAVFIGGLPAPYGSRAACRRHGLLRVDGYHEALSCTVREGVDGHRLEQAMLELEPHFTGVHVSGDAGWQTYLPGDMLSGRLMWWCGLERERQGPGPSWFERIQRRLPWFGHGLWPTGKSELAVGVAVNGMRDGADAVMCAGPGILDGAPLEDVAKGLSRSGFAGIDTAAISRTCREILERSR